MAFVVSRSLALLVSLVLLGAPAAALAQAEAAPAEKSAAPAEAEKAEPKGIGHRLLFWIPNRLFDVLDLVRLRARVGPGFAISARATELLDVTMGGYASVFVGLPGPRGKPRIPWPAGLENLAGIEVSVLDITNEGGRFAPDYGPAEVGAGLQLILVGVDVGVEPLDLLDLAAGIILLDPRGDDF
jgi:hypothetical protein